MEKNKIFEQLKGYVDQLEKMSNTQIYPPQEQAQPRPATDGIDSNYNAVLEQEFIKDEMGQVFAKVQFEAAQKYLIEMYMTTPDGVKLSEEREKAFRAYKDEKLKDFLESKKVKPAPDKEEKSKA